MLSSEDAEARCSQIRYQIYDLLSKGPQTPGFKDKLHRLKAKYFRLRAAMVAARDEDFSSDSESDTPAVSTPATNGANGVVKMTNGLTMNGKEKAVEVSHFDGRL